MQGYKETTLGYPGNWPLFGHRRSPLFFDFFAPFISTTQNLTEILK
jgi:hypothetical protein